MVCPVTAVVSEMLAYSTVTAVEPAVTRLTSPRVRTTPVEITAVEFPEIVAASVVPAISVTVEPDTFVFAVDLTRIAEAVEMMAVELPDIVAASVEFDARATVELPETTRV